MIFLPLRGELGGRKEWPYIWNQENWLLGWGSNSCYCLEQIKPEHLFSWALESRGEKSFQELPTHGHNNNNKKKSIFHIRSHLFLKLHRITLMWSINRGTLISENDFEKWSSCPLEIALLLHPDTWNSTHFLPLWSCLSAVNMVLYVSRHFFTDAFCFLV